MTKRKNIKAAAPTKPRIPRAHAAPVAPPSAPAPTAPVAPPVTPAPKVYDLSRQGDIIQMFVDDVPDEVIQANARNYLLTLPGKHGLNSYFVMVLYDEHTSLESYEANAIYEAATGNNKAKDILLMVHSLGGRVESAYLISKTCRSLAKQRFVVAVPRKAKSAATLLALAAR